MDVESDTGNPTPSNLLDLECKEKISDMDLDIEEAPGMRRFSHSAAAPKTAHRPTPLRMAAGLTDSPLHQQSRQEKCQVQVGKVLQQTGFQPPPVPSDLGHHVEQNMVVSPRESEKRPMDDFTNLLEIKPVSSLRAGSITEGTPHPIAPKPTAEKQPVASYVALHQQSQQKEPLLRIQPLMIPVSQPQQQNSLGSTYIISGGNQQTVPSVVGIQKTAPTSQLLVRSAPSQNLQTAPTQVQYLLPTVQPIPQCSNGQNYVQMALPSGGPQLLQQSQGLVQVAVPVPSPAGSAQVMSPKEQEVRVVPTALFPIQQQQRQQPTTLPTLAAQSQVKSKTNTGSSSNGNSSSLSSGHRQVVVQTLIQHPNGTQQLVQYTLPEGIQPNQIYVPMPQVSGAPTAPAEPRPGSQDSPHHLTEKEKRWKSEVPSETPSLPVPMSAPPYANRDHTGTSWDVVTPAKTVGEGGQTAKDKEPRELKLAPTPAMLGIAKGLARRTSSKSSTGQETPGLFGSLSSGTTETPTTGNFEKAGLPQTPKIVIDKPEEEEEEEEKRTADFDMEIEKLKHKPPNNFLKPTSEDIPYGVDLKSPTKKLFKRQDESMDR